MGRHKGYKQSQAHKDAISKAMRKKHRERRKQQEEAEKRKQARLLAIVRAENPGGRFHDFTMKEMKRYEFVFPLTDVTPNVVFDFATHSISIEVGDFALTQGNLEKEDMKERAKAYAIDGYRMETRERVLISTDHSYKKKMREAKRNK